jgi:acyl carrier protein
MEETLKLKQEVKADIIKFLNLLEVQPDDIADDQPLFGDGLGLDSIDSLELIVMLDRTYGVKINDPKEGRKILVNVNSIVDYIQKHRTIHDQ